ncbi:MAG: Hsp20/alpha crystallin family protein [Bacteroidota bacterium]|jgi:HSP20 family protein|uniref:Hsp20/alpha crystallin family protein n=1 Tax=Candidatus Pollutiaquabacter sp. TaxID=3416354 RepID=UPI002CD9D038|nr:Hsp20/alpha crystallin family protein [Bacteroidia bacterium]HRI42019.1 Hsp20/alpha crystallin family protein [Bacteroidia bacterium]
MRKPIGQFPAMRSLLSDFFETDKLGFDDYFRKDWMPAVNVKDGKDQYEIEVAAPGLKKEDFKIRVEHGILTISSEQKSEKETKEGEYTRREFNYQSFSRSFALPQDVKEEDIQASYADGILKLLVAKKQTVTAKGREIAVK